MDKFTILPKKAEETNKGRVFTVRVTDEMAEKIGAIQGRTGRSRSEVLSILLEFALQHCE